MNILTIWDYRTGEPVRSWNHPGGRKSAVDTALEYGTLVRIRNGRVDVWVHTREEEL